MAWRWLGCGLLISSIYVLIGAGLLAQETAVEIDISRDRIRFEILPTLLRGFTADAQNPVLERALWDKLQELNQGFEKRQSISISLYEVLKDQKDFLDRIRKDYSSYPEKWVEFEDRLKAIRIQATILLGIFPEGDELSAQFKAAERPEDLVAINAELLANPRIELKSIEDLRLVETGLADPSNPEVSVGFPIALRESFTQALKFNLQQVKISVEGVVMDKFRAGQKDDDPFVVDLRGFFTSFQSVELSPTDVEKIMGKLFEGENLFALGARLQRLPSLKKAFGRIDDADPNLLEQDLKAYLDARTTSIVLWIEQSSPGDPKLHISDPEDPKTSQRIEAARARGELILEATADIPLKSKDLKLRVDAEKRRVTASFTPETIASAVFRAKSFTPPQAWRRDVTDPLVNQILDLVYRGDLFEGKLLFAKPEVLIPQASAELSVPIEWKDGVMRLNEEQAKLTLPVLDSATLKSTDLMWARMGYVWGKPIMVPQGHLHFDFNKGAKDLKTQFVSQILPIVKAHEEIFGPVFFEDAEKVLLGEAETLALAGQMTKAKKGDKGIGYTAKVTDFKLKEQGDLSCKLLPGRKINPQNRAELNELMQANFLVPASAPMSMDLMNAESLMEWDCEVTLPKKIGLQLTNVQAPKGDVSAIRFDLVSSGEGGAPKVKVKWRIVRDPESQGLVALPLKMDFDEVAKKYQIPSKGQPGAPEIGTVNGHGIKGFVGDSIQGANTIWQAISPRIRPDESPEAFILDFGLSILGAVSSAKVESIKKSTADEELREAVESAKYDLKRQLSEILWNELNGDLKKRRKLAKYRSQFGRMPIDPWMVNTDFFRNSSLSENYVDTRDPKFMGLLGRAEDRVDEQLEKLSRSELLTKPIGTMMISGKSVRAWAEEEAASTVKDTITRGPDEIEEISETVSNPKLAEFTGALHAKVSENLRTSVVRNWDRVNLGLGQYIREQPEGDPNGKSPLQLMQDLLNQEFYEAARSRTSFANKFLKMPDFCGVSILQTPVEGLGDIYTVFPHLDEAESSKGPPKLAERPQDIPPLDVLLKSLGEPSRIPLSVNTRLLERVANDPENLKRIEELLEAEAKGMDGINESFNLDIKNIRVRIREDGVPVIRASIKVEQKTSTIQDIGKGLGKILGFLPDGLISLIAGEKVKPVETIVSLPTDLVDELVFDIDEFMDFEVPFRMSAGDIYARGQDRVQGHYLHFWSEPENFRVLKKNEGWQSVFGAQAQKKLRNQSADFIRTVNINTPLTIPGYENSIRFELSRSMGDYTDKPLSLGLPNVHEAEGDGGLYHGVFQVQANLKILDQNRSFPSLRVRRSDPRP